MLEKFKGIGSQVATKAGNAVDGVSSSVKGGVESLANSAGNMSDALNDKAVRLATTQMCSIIEIAIDELKSRPLSAHPISLKTMVNVGVAALEMEVHLPPSIQTDTPD
ncbi:MAG: hypothetical protein R8K20_07710 [Gallionellaceae bacterium]